MIFSSTQRRLIHPKAGLKQTFYCRTFFHSFYLRQLEQHLSMIRPIHYLIAWLFQPIALNAQMDYQFSRALIPSSLACTWKYITCSRYIISTLHPVRFFQFYFVFQRSSSFDFTQLIDPVKLKLETFLIQWLLRRQ